MEGKRLLGFFVGIEWKTGILTFFLAKTLFFKIDIYIYFFHDKKVTKTLDPHYTPKNHIFSAKKLANSKILEVSIHS